MVPMDNKHFKKRSDRSQKDEIDWFADNTRDNSAVTVIMEELGKSLAVNTVTNDHSIFIEKGEGSKKDENENIKTTIPHQIVQHKFYWTNELSNVQTILDYFRCMIRRITLPYILDIVKFLIKHQIHLT